jgi:DHA3 family macrolide efflux protein-like MFS transporter
MVIFGLAMPIFNTPATVLLQEKVEENYLGRIFGVLGMISSSMMPIGMLLFGPLSDKVEIEVILIVTGILIMVQSFFMFGSKTLIEAGKPVKK